MHRRFPDTGSLPHPVGWVDFKAKHRESPYREKSKCSKPRESSLMAKKSRILKMFYSGSLDRYFLNETVTIKQGFGIIFAVLAVILVST
jgi:hypothetical protein